MALHKATLITTPYAQPQTVLNQPVSIHTPTLPGGQPRARHCRARPRAPPLRSPRVVGRVCSQRVSQPEMWAESEGQLVQVLFIMFSQPVYSKGECISLYMVLKELKEDSVGQAVYRADELRCAP